MINFILQAAASIAYANLVEYVFHRWVLHRGRIESHLRHHMDPDKPTLLVKWDIWALYAAHAVAFGSLGLWLPVTVIGMYLIALEAAHRVQHRFRFGYHLAHHERSNTRFNVFLPLWDFVLKTI